MAGKLANKATIRFISNDPFFAKFPTPIHPRICNLGSEIFSGISGIPFGYFWSTPSGAAVFVENLGL